MGTIHHTTVTVIGSNENVMRDIHFYAKGKKSLLVTELMKTPVNGYYTFAILPDGSKEGWEESNRADEAVEEVTKYIHENGGYTDYAITRFGELNNSVKTNFYEDDEG